jgi:hypothetical protein
MGGGIVSNEARALQGLRRSLEVLGSHVDGLRDKAEGAYSAGNHEQYEAYGEHIDYCEDRIMAHLTAVGAIVQRLREKYGVEGEQ